MTGAPGRALHRIRREGRLCVSFRSTALPGRWARSFGGGGVLGVELDTSKIDDAVLALLFLGLHDGTRAWKGFDWDAMDRLHRAGLISDPRGKAKSVAFSEEGLRRAERLLNELFGKRD